MAYVGPSSHNVVVVLHVGGSKASRTLSLFYIVSLVLVKHGFLPVRLCRTKSMLMMLFASYLRKLALP
jgi:hypothetical protein